MPAPADQRSERALQAMADAVERSRRGAAAASRRDRFGDPSVPPSEGPPTETPPREPPRREEEPLERRLRWGIVVAAFLVAAVLVAALLTHGSNGPGRVGTGSSGTSTSAGSHRTTNSSPPANPSGSGAASSTSTSTTTSAAPPPPGSGPEVASIGPDAGTAGQQVTLNGSGLVSADGQVQALFDGQPAATACPAPDTCTATVPDLPGPARSVAVTVVTSAGTSAPVDFSYGGSGAPTPASLAGPSAANASPGGDGSHHGAGGHHRGN